MNKLKLLLALSAAATVASASAVQAAELILNGGFENGTYTDAGGNSDAPIDWATAPSFDYGGGDVNGVDGIPHSGSHGLSIGNYDAQTPASISQSFADVAGASYVGSFYVFAGSSSDPNANFTAEVDGSPAVSIGDSVSSYTEETFNFIGTGSDTLTFLASTNPNEWHLDDVSVTGPAAGVVSAIPEPSTWLLMFTGIGAIGLMMRRTKKSTEFRFKNVLAA